MSVFTVTPPNRCGELARLCEAMADSGINLVLCATMREAGGTVAFIADDEAISALGEQVVPGANLAS